MSSKSTGTGNDVVIEPQVSVYPASKPQSNGKRVLLCQVRGMFLDLLRVTWQAEDQRGSKVELKDDEQLEQRDKGQVYITSMLIVDQHKVTNNKFTCSVQHDSRVKDKKVVIPRDDELLTEEDNPEIESSTVMVCPTPKEVEVEEREEEVEMSDKEIKQDVFELSCSLHLFRVTYVILLVKNVLYFCTASVLLCKKNAKVKS
ncbi:hypothetical protein PHYPO_G00196700 [Pangasianodon hypophthalmus]|uniref:Ig-like domain-containing protein n=1 Tax=Pangasianodon hypophthalmus TaxID=310915 RepID=A0A5N5PL67_PANHP|nr:hypothetical protein PHYPO_G00196700 [Pangasianodon hypophthalmus]